MRHFKVNLVTTFYAHYQDKEDLLLSGIDEVVDSLISGDTDLSQVDLIERTASHVLSTEIIFRHAQEEYQLHKAIFVGRGVEMMIKEIQNHICRDKEEQNKHYQLENLPRWNSP